MGILGCESKPRMPVTTRIITCFVEDPNVNLHFLPGTGKGGILTHAYRYRMCLIFWYWLSTQEAPACHSKNTRNHKKPYMNTYESYTDLTPGMQPFWRTKSVGKKRWAWASSSVTWKGSFSPAWFIECKEIIISSVAGRCVYIYIYLKQFWNFNTSQIWTYPDFTFQIPTICTVWTGGAPPKSSVHQETYVDSGISTLEPSHLPPSWGSSHPVQQGGVLHLCIRDFSTCFPCFGQTSFAIFWNRNPTNNVFFLNRGTPTLCRFGASRKTNHEIETWIICYQRWSKHNDIRYIHIYTYIYILIYIYINYHLCIISLSN